MTHHNPPVPKKHSIALALGCLLSSAAAADVLPGFTLVELEDLNFNASEAHAINNFSLTAGSSIAGNGFDAEPRPVVWDANGNATQLEDSVAPSLSTQSVFAINDLGNMVGLREGTGLTVWFDLVPTSIPSAGAINDINNVNQLAGAIAGTLEFAAIWNGLVPTLLGGEPDGFSSEALAVNELGHAVGLFRNETFFDFPVSWIDGQAIFLGTLPGFDPVGVARDNNDIGQVVGYSGFLSTLPHRAVIWENGLIADLGSFGGDSSEAFDINNAGQVIGLADTADGQTRPFLWENGVMYDLSPALCADLNNCIIELGGINDLGQIAYTHHEASFNNAQAFRLTIADGALETLPSVPAPLNFVVPDGAGPTDGQPPQFGEADIAVTLDTNVATVTRGDLYEYHITLDNIGPTTAFNTIAVSEIRGTVRLRLDLSDSNCNLPSSATTLQVICEFDRIDPNTTATAVLAVEHLRGGRVTNTATVDSESFDPDPANNSATLTTRISR